MNTNSSYVGSSDLTAESLAKAAHTPGPWAVGEYDETLGYDCMTGGIRVGPVCLDGADYGQKWCKEITPSALERMKADARLISAAPDLLEVLREIVGDGVHCDVVPHLHRKALAAIAKATA